MSEADEEYWRRLAHDWTHSEGPGLEQRQWRKRFRSKRPGREHMMAADVRELLAELPERVRVWRGAVRDVNETGLSWTVVRADAVAWAHRNVGLHGDGVPVVLRASVAREDIIALFVERLEAEILAFPEHVSVEAVEDVSHEPPPDRHDRLPPAMMRPWGLVAGDAWYLGPGVTSRAGPERGTPLAVTNTLPCRGQRSRR